MGASDDVMAGFNSTQSLIQAKKDKDKVDKLNQLYNRVNYNSVRDYNQPGVVGDQSPMLRRLNVMNNNEVA